MHFFWQAVLKDIRRQRDDPWKPALWVGIPLVIATLITLAFGGQQGGPQVTVELLVADEDDSFISGLLVGALSQDAADGLFHVENVQRDAGRTRIEEDSATALLVIPDGFGKAMLREQPMELLLVTNPSQQILPRIAEETMRILIDGSFYAHRILGAELRQLADWIDDDDSEIADQQISQTSVRINQIAKRISRHLDPLAIEVEMAVDDKPDQTGSDGESKADQPSGQEVSMAFYFFPGMLIMALFFASDGLSWDIWTERENGTLRRLVTTPRSLIVFLAGKCVAACVMIFAMSVILLVAGLYYYDRSWSVLPLAAVWMLMSGCVLWSIMVTIQLFASSQRAGTVLTSAATFPLLMLGGSFFPFEAMPGWMASIGRWTPNGWMLEHLKTIIVGNVEISSLLTAAALLLAAFVMFFLIASRRLYSIRNRA